jgi:hypothetical protein
MGITWSPHVASCFHGIFVCNLTTIFRKRKTASWWLIFNGSSYRFSLTFTHYRHKYFTADIILLLQSQPDLHRDCSWCSKSMCSSRYCHTGRGWGRVESDRNLADRENEIKLSFVNESVIPQRLRTHRIVVQTTKSGENKIVFFGSLVWVLSLWSVMLRDSRGSDVSDSEGLVRQLRSDTVWLDPV